jgi:predicted nucleic acid-binding protein
VRIVLDACVLFPTVMREMLLGAAGLGHYTPLWSDRLLEEWARAAARIGPDGEAQARAEIALLKATWPGSTLPPAPGVEARLWLPDQNDLHVLAVAVAGSADALITVNRKDFPRNILAEEGLTRLDPDGVLYDIWLHDPDGMAQIGARVLQTARDMSNPDWTLRALLKKARLPRLGKALGS